MGKIWTMLIFWGLLGLGCPTAGAQTDSLLHQADRMLNYKAYGRAIDIYTQILTEQADQLTPAQKANAQGKLAYTYQQVGDGPKAERYYREALDNNPTEDLQLLLQYAQTLAGNGKFKESQQQYEHYLQLKDKLPPQRLPSGTINDIAAERTDKEPTKYRLEYLTLNSAGEEFSPAFYQNGLVYVGGTKGGAAIETLSKGGGSGYLDLFYVPNRKILKVSSIIRADGRTSRVINDYAKTNQYVGDDFFTPPTPNDSRTLPSFEQGVSISRGLGYDDQPTDPAQRFGQEINTKYHEGPATFSADGSRIVFTRNNYSAGRARKDAQGVTKLKLYTARQQNGTWTDVVELPFNSDNYSVGHPTLSRDGQLLYFASDMPGGSGGTDLYVSQYQNGQWGKPVNLGNAVNTKGNELFPFVDDAGNLYFASDGRRGLGGLDIFFVTLANATTVRSLEHLDAPINSPQDDFGLITDANRSGGYLSSNRRGSDDIYRFVRESSLYGCRDLTIRFYDTNTDQALDSTAVLIKTKGEGHTDRTMMTDANGFVRLCLERNNDFMFQASRDGYINGTAGFTTRALTDDQPSRLEIGLIKPTPIMDTVATESASSDPLTRSRVRGVVVNERDGRPIEGVTVRLRNECDNTQVEYVTGPSGSYTFDLTEGCDYTLIASKPAFGTNTNKIKRLPRKAKPKELSADLRLLSVGDVVTIDNIYYDLDQYSLRPDATRELDKLVATMRRYPSLIIEIRSHTDSRGDAARNKGLSLERAQQVANYLVSKGISRRRMSVIGMGESQLVNNCTDGVICTEAEHQRNRRTEFRVVEIK